MALTATQQTAAKIAKTVAKTAITGGSPVVLVPKIVLTPTRIGCGPNEVCKK